jgi:hypothetical protein
MSVDMKDNELNGLTNASVGICSSVELKAPWANDLETIRNALTRQNAVQKGGRGI